MIVVHHLDNTRSQRVLWLLEELTLPYRIVHESYHFQNLELSPVITDGEVTLSECGAIIYYIIQKYGLGKFQVPGDRVIDDVFFAHYSEGSLLPLVYQKYVCSPNVIRSTSVIRRFFLKIAFKFMDKHILLPELRKHADMAKAHLSRTQATWFAGGSAPSAADFLMIFPLEGLCAFGIAGPCTHGYVKNVHER
ncbi:hypothetical protein FISHEDRAFT_39401 [Fistulina hepatica ATCC 64428]|uniref:GST N-terminal domain-containing protein n=1 Tax=Fistulina hepatica ATCC 64428 TaxID=1128425 RepID=A0A0D7AG51_9AGAR|nr:hypothetical protein FISHEDRAFT_39401 [Fistulina hepatica ATCC 64428]